MTSTVPLVRPDAANPNTTIQTILAQAFSSATALRPAGNDSSGVDDAPLAIKRWLLAHEGYRFGA